MMLLFQGSSAAAATVCRIQDCLPTLNPRPNRGTAFLSLQDMINGTQGDAHDTIKLHFR